MSSVRNNLMKFLIRLGAAKAKNLNPTEMRSTFEKQSAAFGAPPKGTLVTPFAIKGCPVEWLAKDSFEKQRTLLYLHGGAYVFGSLDSHRTFVCTLAAASDAKALNVGYRLAPEHPFPAAFDDACQAYRWLLDEGHDPSQIIIAGDSSGGALAVAVLMHLKEQNLPMPAAGVLISPWTDLTLSGDSMTTNEKTDSMCRKAKLNEWGDQYRGQTPQNAPRVSPLFGDFSGLPPLMISVSSDEILYSDSTRMAEKARKAGVFVELNAVPDMIHVWPLFNKFIPEARDAVIKIGNFIQARTPSRQKKAA